MLESLGLFFFVLGLGILPLSSPLLGSTVDSSKVRIFCPSISFLFACLGASLGVSRSFCPLVEDFVFGGCGLSLMLADLLPLLHQSLNWFEDLVGERRVMPEVRSSELETRLSSSDDPIEMVEDTAAFGPRVVRAFSALKEVCGLDDETLSKFRDKFQFLERVFILLCGQNMD